MAVDGSWNIKIQMPMGERQATVTFKTDGTRLVPNEQMLYDGSVNGSEVSWKTNISDPMALTLQFKGTVNGDAISGSVSTNFGVWKFSGTRA